jgi:hypothetical protein
MIMMTMIIAEKSFSVEWTTQTMKAMPKRH